MEEYQRRDGRWQLCFYFFTRLRDYEGDLNGHDYVCDVYARDYARYDYDHDDYAHVFPHVYRVYFRGYAIFCHRDHDYGDDDYDYDYVCACGHDRDYVNVDVHGHGHVHGHVHVHVRGDDHDHDCDHARTHDGVSSPRNAHHEVCRYSLLNP